MSTRPAKSPLSAGGGNSPARMLTWIEGIRSVGTASVLSRSVRIFKTYGADAIQVLSENPYRLARDVRGIGFKTADAIAERLGIEKTAMIRPRAGIGVTLTEALATVDRLLADHPELPIDIRRKVLQARDELERTVAIRRAAGAIAGVERG